MTDPAAKECPTCTMQIPAAAQKCPHCHEWLIPASSPAHIRWEGDLLVLPRGVSIPPLRCLVCGAAEDVHPKRKSFTYAEFSDLTSKRESIELPMCGRCSGRRFWGTVAAWLIGAGGLCGFPIAGGFLGEAIGGRDSGPAGIGFGFFLWFAGLIAIAIWSMVGGIRCRRIDGQSIMLKFPNPGKTRQALEESIGSGGSSSMGTVP